MQKNKYAISDDVWAGIQPYIPARENTHPRGGGRKPKDDRLVFEAILFILRFGCQWEVLNAAGMCPSSTVNDRFRKWYAAGVFHRLTKAGILELNPATAGIDWSWLSDETEAPSEAAAKPPARQKFRPDPARAAWRGRDLKKAVAGRYDERGRDA